MDAYNFRNNAPERHSHLYVCQFPTHWSENDLKEVFEQFGALEIARVITQPDAGENRGVGFVHYQNVEHAEAALNQLHQTCPKGCAHPIVVKYANQKSKAQRQQQQQQQQAGGAGGQCNFFLKGKCKKGNFCEYTHDGGNGFGYGYGYHQQFQNGFSHQQQAYQNWSQQYNQNYAYAAQAFANAAAQDIGSHGGYQNSQMPNNAGGHDDTKAGNNNNYTDFGSSGRQNTSQQNTSGGSFDQNWGDNWNSNQAASLNHAQAHQQQYGQSQQQHQYEQPQQEQYQQRAQDPPIANGGSF